MIVPARNEEHNTAGCIGSLLQQGSGIKIAGGIIVADNGSEEKAGWVPYLDRPGGEDIVSTCICRRLSEMWEGWTKNLFLLYHGDSGAVWREAAAIVAAACRCRQPGD